MDMGHWREHFAQHILERGYDYFHDGHVTNLEKNEDGYIGTVSGSKDYSVEISIDDGFYMECSCPHADGGSNCKHMVALLCEIETGKGNESTSSKRTDKSSANSNEESMKLLSEVLEKLSPDIIKSELQRILESDKNLRAGFLLKHNQNEKSIENYMKIMKNAAWEIKYECSDRHGFVDYHNADTYTSRLIDEVLNELNDFATNENEEKQRVAFDVSLLVLGQYAETDIDDDGDTLILTEECIELWEKILSSCESECLAHHIYTELAKFCDKADVEEYISYEIDDFISEYFNDGHFLADRLERVDRRIELFVNGERWYDLHTLSEAVMERLSIMDELGKSQTERDVFRNKFNHLPAIREIMMNELESVNDLEGLISFLLESKKIDHGSQNHIESYSRKLIELYKKLGDSDRVRDELHLYITKYRRGDVGAFFELKSYYSAEEWIDVREELFNYFETEHIDIKPLLAKEGLKGRLMYILVERLEKNLGMAEFIITEIKRYESYLRPEFDQKLLDIYSETAERMAKRTGGRNHYKKIAEVLKHMRVYPGGKERTQEMVDEWRVEYKSRRAMMEELRAF